MPQLWEDKGGGGCKGRNRIGRTHPASTQEERKGRSHAGARARARACVYLCASRERRNDRAASKTGSENGMGVHAHVRTRTHTCAHTEKFIPENRGCVSTSMAAGRSMHSPPPELTDAGRRGGQPLHARCHRNALSLKHRLIITDARPFSLSLPLLGRHLYTPLGLSRWGTRRLLQPTLRFSPRFPPFLAFALSFSRPFSLLLSPVLTSLFRQRARCPRFSFCLTCLRVAVACVMTGMVGTRATDPFALQGTFSRSNYYRTASCTTSWTYPK